ncbi:MAG: electron transfer flavoprotein subunit alpha/FixB family protein [Hyphomicrobiales bacterium]|nr:electron transfer flavoprotein subunit alpha/FixB family protein [Hyphomicrobiales bacterium]
MSGILVVAEQLDGELCDVSGELIGAANAIKTGVGGPLQVLVIGKTAKDLAAKVNLDGVDEILTVQTESDHFDPLVYEEIICKAGSDARPSVILIGHTASGLAYGAAVSARLGSGFASDVFILSMDGDELVATRSAYGNKLEMELGFSGKGVVLLTLRGATFVPPETEGSAKITPVEVDLAALEGLSTHVEYQEAPPSDIDIAKADFILSVGRGIQDKDNLPRFSSLANKLGATFGCSRPIVDSGWLPKPHQVGQSGKVASNCQLYFALGISGAVQHLFGMKHVDTIIAVNTDPGAPIFNVATYGTTVDLFELTDALERHFN